MIHPDTEIRQAETPVGYGVFATREIPRGTITWARDPLDQVFTPYQLMHLDPTTIAILERFTWIDQRGYRTLCWDIARYMNHNCDANCFGLFPFEFEFAVRDILAGDEVTCEYATLNLEAPLQCACGTASCRGMVSPGDLEVYAPVWDDLIRSSFPAILEVTQPLRRWVTNYARVKRLAKAPMRLPSIADNRYCVRATPITRATGTNGY